MAREKIHGANLMRFYAALPQPLALRCRTVERDRCAYQITFRGPFGQQNWEYVTIEVPESWGLTSARTVAKICLELP